MKFSATRDDIHHAVSAVQRATATRIIQPILANIYVEALPDSQQLKLAATDMDFSAETIISAEVQEPGKTTISAKKLTEILSKLPSAQSVAFDIELTSQTAHIQCGLSQFDVRTMPAEEFPLIPQVLEGDPYLDVDLKTFIRAINQTVFAAASYEASNVLGGVFFKLSPDALEMVATDGSRLARRVEAITDGKVTEPLLAIIPAKAMQEFVKLVSISSAKEEHVRISIKEGQIFLATGSIRVVSRLLDGQYPKYEQLIPAENTIVAYANKADLIASLERTSVMANERTNIVKMALDNTHLSLSANTPDIGDSKDVVQIRYDGDPLSIAFNYKYVLDALKVIESDDIRMETNGSLAPTIFRSDDAGEYICLVMPVQVK